jgi:hypothetical protein
MDEEMQKVYRTFKTIQSDGSFFATMYWPKSLPVEHPNTIDSIPDDLKAKLPYYDWDHLKWIDGSADLVKLQLSQFAADLKDTDGKAVTAGTTATTAKQTADSANSQAEQLQAALLEISDLVLSSTIAKDDGKTETAEGGTKA